MACGKPSGSFSHNPAEGYRIPHQLKITQNPCIQKKGYFIYLPAAKLNRNGRYGLCRIIGVRSFSQANPKFHEMP